MKSVVLRFRVVDRDKFNDIILNRKLVETRAATIKYKNIQAGDNLIIVCGRERILKSVQKVEYYQSIKEMLSKIYFKNILPSVISKDEAIKVWDSFPGYSQKIKENGILAFYI
jgi:ASC-1-like (ASCH) protein